MILYLRLSNLDEDNKDVVPAIERKRIWHHLKERLVMNSFQTHDVCHKFHFYSLDFVETIRLPLTVQRHAAWGGRLTGTSTLAIAVNVSANACCLSVLALQEIDYMSMVYPAFHPMAAGIGLDKRKRRDT